MQILSFSNHIEIKSNTEYTISYRCKNGDKMLDMRVGPPFMRTNSSMQVTFSDSVRYCNEYNDESSD